MKVLFAVNNEKITESVIKKYQANYKEIISAKNVYYFNAIIKELQRDKSYDRVVISEDLEPFSNRSYDMMDKFIFEKLDSISDEASNSEEGEIPIILICTDRREKSDPMLVRLFSIGIYSGLMGQDRTIENLCELINKPRSKREAKKYYRIDSDDAEYKSEKIEDIPEAEMKNILNHYKKLGKNEDRYIESFNNIASQYSKEQLKVIAKLLPLNVRAVLEERCPKYQEVMIESVKGKIKSKEENAITTRNIKSKNNTSKIDLIEKQINKPRMTKPVVIPSTVNLSKVHKVYEEQINEEPEEQDSKQQKNNNNYLDDVYNTETKVETPKRGRGRPKKEKEKQEREEIEEIEEPVKAEAPKRGRGRPKKETDENEQLSIQEIQQKSNEESGALPGFEDEEEYKPVQTRTQNEFLEEENFLPEVEENESDVLPGFEQENFEEEEEEGGNILPGFEENVKESIDNTYQDRINNSINNQIQVAQLDNTPNNLPNLLTADKKIVAFVGTSKNGTSFLVNNLAEMLSLKGINTAILDLTKNKNAYYIYTQNDENLRVRASKCIDNLRSGIAAGIEVHKNLTVYTTSPNEDTGIDDYANILETLVKNYSLVLLDCDFLTNYNYFKETQEIYIVQSYDILTIQPLTAFLRELKDRNILPQNKLRIVINKALKVRELNEKIIVGGISSYNDPTMSYMKELFDRNTVIYTTIPFEDQTYSKYLEGLVNCEISLKGYSKGLLESIEKLGNMVYPLINSKLNKKQNTTVQRNYNDYSSRNNKQFGGNIEDTLSKMRRKY